MKIEIEFPIRWGSHFNNFQNSSTIIKKPYSGHFIKLIYFL